MPDLIDSHFRKIDYMRISITDRCNLRCRYCMPDGGISPLPHREILSYEEILRLVRIAANLGVTKVRVTGGEPLVRRGIVCFLERFRQIQGLEDITITTNGILLADMAHDLAQAGIRRINISLDTLDREKFYYITRKDLLLKVMEGIKASERAGFSPIKINCVAIKGFNDEEILDFVNLTIEHPYHVRFIEFMPFVENDFWTPDKGLHAPEIKDIISKRYTLSPVASRSNQSGPARRFRIEGGAGEIGFISALSQHFCETCNRIRLTPDGKLRNCLFSDQEVDIKKALRSGADDQALQNIIKDSIRTKPPGHTLHEDASHKCKRSMWKIGG